MSERAKAGDWVGTVLMLPTWLAAGTLFVLMAMTFADVVLRSAFNAPFPFGTEMTRIFMGIIVFSALPLVTWQSKHIVVDLMDPLFSRALARWRDIAIDLICGVLLFWPAQRVWVLAERARDYGNASEYLGIPEFYMGWFIAAFTCLTAVAFVSRAVTRVIWPQEAAREGAAE